MNCSLFVIITVVALDAIGIGLIFPILPSLLEELTGSGEVSTVYGVILAAYAAMQFIFSPILGLLSDRLGRRPVHDRLARRRRHRLPHHGVHPDIGWVLVVGRIIAGITSANMSVARSLHRRHFRGEGPGSALQLDERSVRCRLHHWADPGRRTEPLFPARAIPRRRGAQRAEPSAGLLVVKEGRVPSREKLDLKGLNPFAPLKWAFSFPALAPLLALFLIFAINGDIPGTIAVLYSQANFHWDGVMIGLWLAAFGAFHFLAQAFVTGPLTKRLGERRTLIVGIVADVLAFLGFGFATQGWMAFALSPLSAIGGVGLPALQSLMSAEVSEDRQGELQGVLASAQSLTSILGPLIGTTIFFWTQPYFVGAVWLVAAALYLLAIPVLATSGPAAARAGLSSAGRPAVSRADERKRGQIARRTGGKPRNPGLCGSNLGLFD